MGWICFVIISDVLKSPLSQDGSTIPAATASLTTWKEMAACFLEISQAGFCEFRMTLKLSQKILVGAESSERDITAETV